MLIEANVGNKVDVYNNIVFIICSSNSVDVCFEKIKKGHCRDGLMTTDCSTVWSDETVVPDEKVKKRNFVGVETKGTEVSVCTLCEDMV